MNRRLVTGFLPLLFPRFVTALAVLALLAPAAGAGGTLCSVVGPKGATGFATRRLALLGDFDGDGTPDVAVTDPIDSTVAPAAGAAYVLRVGACGAVWSLHGSFAGDTLSTVAAPGDLDGDGLADIVVGLPGDDSAALNGGRVAAWHGGAQAAALWSFSGVHAQGLLGEALAVVGDVDLDGFPDVAAGAPAATPASVPLAGRVAILSGATGQLLFDVQGNAAAGSFSWTVTGVGDLDLDGRADFAVGASSGFLPTTKGSVHVYAGAGGALLTTVTGPDGFGREIRYANDVDGDGQPDLLVLATWNLENASLFRMSLVNGAVHLEDSFVISYPYSVLRECFDVVGDVNGDGLDDFVLPASGTSLELRRGGDGALLAHLEGQRVTGLGDLDVDGFGDYALVRYDSAQKTQELELLSGRCDRVVPYGEGCSAAGQPTPRLAVTGACDLDVGASFEIVLDRAPSQAPALFVFGIQPTTIPIGGCVLHVTPIVGPLLSVTTDASGRAALAAVVPPGLSGLNLPLQAFALDPLAPAGFVGSNGLALHFP